MLRPNVRAQAGRGRSICHGRQERRAARLSNGGHGHRLGDAGVSSRRPTNSADVKRERIVAAAVNAISIGLGNDVSAVQVCGWTRIRTNPTARQVDRAADLPRAGRGLARCAEFGIRSSVLAGSRDRLRRAVRPSSRVRLTVIVPPRTETPRVTELRVALQSVSPRRRPRSLG